MNDPHDENAERLRRIRKASAKADPTASTSEPSPDVLTQKIVQELMKIKRQNAELTEQVKEIRLEQQKQSAELNALKSRHRTQIERQNQQQERAASKAQATAASATDTKMYVDDKLLTFKVQLGCFCFVVALVVAVFWFVSERDDLEPQQSSTTHLPVFEERRAR